MLTGSLITLMCSQVIAASPTYSPACSKAFEAAIVQSGTKASLDQAENWVQTEVKNRSPKEAEPVAAVGVMLYKRSLHYSFSATPISARVGIQADAGHQSMSLSWSF